MNKTINIQRDPRHYVCDDIMEGPSGANQSLAINLIPNPAVGNFKTEIITTERGDVLLEIIQANATHKKMVHKLTITSNVTSISNKISTPGLYYVIVTMGNKRVSKTLIVK